MKNAKKIFFLVMGSILILAPFFNFVEVKAEGSDAILPATLTLTIISPTTSYSSTAQTLTVYYKIDKPASVYFFADEQQLPGAKLQSVGSYSYTFTSLSVNEHKLKIKACDAFSCSIGEVIYKVIESATVVSTPVITIESPEEGKSSAEKDVLIKYTLSKDADVYFYQDGAKVNSLSTQKANITNTYTFTDVSVGSHIFKLKACDALNCSETNLTYTIIAAADVSAPILVLASPTANQSGIETNIKFVYSVDKTSNMSFIKDGATVFTIGKLAGSNYEYTFNNLTVGLHTLKIQACNSASPLLCSTTKEITYTVLIADAPVVTITKPVADYSSTANTLTVTYNLSKGATVYSLDNDKKVNGTGKSAGSNVYTFENLTLGKHVLKIQACNSLETLCTDDSINYTVLKTTSNTTDDTKIITPTITTQPNLQAVGFEIYNANTLEKMIIDPKIGETVFLLPNIKNSSSKTISDKFWYKVYLNDELVSAGMNIGILSPESAQLLGGSYKWVLDKASKYTFKLMVDSENQIIESSETDNTFEKIINFGDEVNKDINTDVKNNLINDETKEIKETIVSDYALDIDEDGLTNYQEYLYNTDPNKFDTDGDGFGDLKEIRNGYSPLINENKKDPNVLSSGIYGKFVPISPEFKTKAIEKLKTDLKEINNNIYLTIPTAYFKIYLDAFMYGVYTPQEIYDSFKKGLDTVHPTIEAVTWRNRKINKTVSK